MNFEYLETPRLLLRKIDAKVYQHVFTQYNETEIAHFFGTTSEESLLRERQYFEHGLESFERSFVAFHLLEKGSDMPIGWIGYTIWYTRHARAEVGYHLFDDSSKRKGFMSEALSAVLKYGFEEMKLHRVEACIAPENEASIGLVRKFGFQLEGHLREHYWKNGVFEDSLIFALLAP
jgi:ribosomal-protein-alanine N-acetyltransferase